MQGSGDATPDADKIVSNPLESPVYGPAIQI